MKFLERFGATSSRSGPGQILVMTGLMLAVIIGIVAIVVDAGFAWGQFRHTQNGTDAAAEAGALRLMQHLNGTAVVDDATVNAAVNEAGAANDVTIVEAYYTDMDGALLRSDGSTTTNPAEAARVGSGAIPPCAANCAGPDAAGVRATGSRVFGTYFARILGVDTLTTKRDATAVAGWVQEPCEDANGCPLIPVTVPVTIVSCNNQNRPVPEIDPVTGQPKPYLKYVHYTLPLCHSDPGNVGWLDWTPPAGGVSELAEEIRHPKPRTIVMPEWHFVTETGNVNASQVEDAINLYAGQIVFIPMFDSSCNIDPPGAAVDACPPPNVGGNGQNQWYHLPQFGAFLLDAPKGAFINGNNTADCTGSSGATSCLRGMFVDFQIGGTVGTDRPDDPNAAVFSGIQLIH